MHEITTQLIHEGIVTRAALNRAQEYQKSFNIQPETLLVLMGLLEEQELVRRLAKTRLEPIVPKEWLKDIPREVITLMPSGWLMANRIIPVARDDKAIHWAMVEPEEKIIHRLKLQTKMEAECHLLPELWYLQAAEKYFRARMPPVPRHDEDNELLPPKMKKGKEAEEETVELTDPEEFFMMFGNAQLDQKVASARADVAPQPVAVAPPAAPPPIVSPPAEPVRAAAPPPAAPAPPPAVPAGPSLNERPLPVAEASERLAEVGDKDEVARLACRAALSSFKRCVIFIVREGMAIGWDGLGEGLSAEKAQTIMIPLGSPSLLQSAHDSGSTYLGPAEKTMVNDRLIKILGGEPPVNALVVPILLGSKVINLLYCDDGPGSSLQGEVSDMQILGSACARAYQQLISRAKAQRTTG